MAKPPKEDNKTQSDPFDPFDFALPAPVKHKKGETESAEKSEPPNPQPSLQTIGLTDCSVCRAEVSVVLTRSGHPFTACGKCGARTFYNSHIAIQILKRHLRELEEE
jgi:hypothetical protein